MTSDQSSTTTATTTITTVTRHHQRLQRRSTAATTARHTARRSHGRAAGDTGDSQGSDNGSGCVCASRARVSFFSFFISFFYLTKYRFPSTTTISRPNGVQGHKKVPRHHDGWGSTRRYR